jgi:GNAT superfamily N-acetyltransferase
MTTPHFELCDERECRDLEDFLVDRIYEFNARATGCLDGRLVGGRLRDEAGDVVAGFNGHTWGGCCVLVHVWVHEALRGRGLGRALMHAAESEAARRGCGQVVLSTHSFQAPAFYERLGYARLAVIPDQPKGHADLVYVKRLRGAAAAGPASPP